MPRFSPWRLVRVTSGCYQCAAMLLDAVFYLAAVVFGGMAIRTLWHLRWVNRLPPLEEQRPASYFVSVVFAARDEGERVAGTIRHLLAQEHVTLEVICVDDRSQDKTFQIMTEIARADVRVRPERINELPDGWLGKCHACHVGAEKAKGDWILFTDADCWLKPDVLARALCVAEAEGVEHITLTPGVSPQTIPAEAWHITFLMTLADWISRVNRDHPKGHLGMGAFNLVKTGAYRKFEGHEPLRMTVVDDIKLGKLVRSGGGRTRAFIGGDDVECHWGITARQMIKIMEKNYFAAMDYNLPGAIVVGTVLPVLWACCAFGIFSGRASGLVAGACLLLNIVPALRLARKLEWPIRGALMMPMVLPALFYAVLNSAVVTLKQGGIRWRDTFYPLAKLRSGNYY